ncbi:SpoIIE family protein phosphatase [Streptomyces sp. NPDC018693]|uniref:SpoIIE family protein phosphatase n=1 Tax=unclassified Streptomyces TaxID=2593676 RepID=UPI00378FCDE3
MNRRSRAARHAPGAGHLFPRLHSLSGQVLLLLVLTVVLLVAAAVAALVVQARHLGEKEAREISLTVAKAYANSPGLLAALNSPDPSATLQPMTEKARREADLTFLVVADEKGTRLTHPQPERIGTRLLTGYEPATEGQVVEDKLKGNFGWEYRAIVPVLDDGEVVGLVVAGLRTGEVSEAVNDQLPVLLGSAAGVLALATGGVVLAGKRLRRQTHGLGPEEITRMYEHHDAVLHAVREGLVIVDTDRRLLVANDEAQRLLDLPPDVQGRPVGELGLTPSIAELLSSGRVAQDELHPAGDRFLAVNQQRTHWQDHPLGTVATLRDTTELRALAGQAVMARERLKLLYDASVGVGTTLDVTRTAEELTRVTVPLFADFVAVDLFDSVLQGEEPASGGADLRRAAIAGRTETSLYPVGSLVSFKPATPQATSLTRGHSVLEPDLTGASGWRSQDPPRTGKILQEGINSLITVPLRARGTVLGVTSFYRDRHRAPFDEDDLSVAEEIAGRAALSVENARRYTREHTMAVSLQRSLLPQGLPDQSAVEVAHRYLPAQAGAGGDWFDVIPLSGARVALVVGDVVGHGLHAAATMGRLRTAVQNFSDLDLAPDELLTHLDDLVGRLDQEADTTAHGSGIIGATCLYAIYDPATRRCTLANAGHPAPAVVSPDGTVSFTGENCGPPLGLGGHPFETVDLDIPEGSRLVLYTDGLINSYDQDMDVGRERLRQALAHPGRSPEETCEAVLDAVVPVDPARPTDDVALLVARTRATDQRDIAHWDVPAEPSRVAEMRSAVAEQLEHWELEELVFSTELILSELLTNAIRYGADPIQVRLLRGRSLICEVSDGSSTSPHLRRATATDEGGRGLFLVAQLSQRWGTRYTDRGKIIWSEQSTSASSASSPVLDGMFAEILAE